MIAPTKPKPFALGQVVATRGALAAIEEAGQSPIEFLIRHVRNDWGEVCAEDWAQNDAAVADGDRLHSTYRTALGVRLWVITEARRDVTTILLPDEY